MENEGNCVKANSEGMWQHTHTESLMRDVMLKTADKAAENKDVSI